MSLLAILQIAFSYFASAGFSLKSDFQSGQNPPALAGGRLVQDKRIKILATFDDALPDSFSSDLPVGDIVANGSWSELEDIYQVNLDPKLLKGEPAVIEGTLWKGKVILSLIHFDTPNDLQGGLVLQNIWKYFLGTTYFCKKVKKDTAGIMKRPNPELELLFKEIKVFETMISELIDIGERNFLWFWRKP